MTVLSQTDVLVLGSNGWFIGLFGISVFITILLVVFMIYALSEGEGLLTLGSMVIAIAFGIISNITYGWASDTLTQYKVIIDDFNVVHEDYEIIDQEGEIYTVIKKGAK